MELSVQKQFFDLLKNEIAKTGMDIAPAPGIGDPQVGDGFRALIPVTDEGDPVLMEFMVRTLDSGADILQYYTTVAVDLSPKTAPELHEAIPAMNFFLPLGSFGIYNGDQLYHKFGLPLSDGAPAEQLFEEAYGGLITLYDVLDQFYPLAMGLAEGSFTFQQAVDKGVIRRI